MSFATDLQRTLTPDRAALYNAGFRVYPHGMLVLPGLTPTATTLWRLTLVDIFAGATMAKELTSHHQGR